MGQSLSKPVTEKKSHQGSSENLRYGVSGMQGWRVSMEDTHASVLSISELDPNWSYFAVFDGHAGSKASEICSTDLLKVVIENYRTISAKVSRSSEAFDELMMDSCLPKDVAILAKAVHDGFIDLDEQMKNEPLFKSNEVSCGTTALAAFITPSHIIFANCGDSRGIFCRDGALFFETKDHKPSNPEEKARIENAGGCVYMDRVNGNLAVSRAIGDFSFKTNIGLPSIEQAVSPEPTISAIPRSSGDQFIVLACDGIWDVMTSEMVAKFVSNRLKVVENVSDICDCLIDACLYQNSRDNMTTLIVCFDGAPTLDPVSVTKEREIEEKIKSATEKIVEQDNSNLGAYAVIGKLSRENWAGLDDVGIYYKVGFVLSILDQIDPSRDKSLDFGGGGLMSDLPISLQIVRNLASGQGFSLRRDEM